MNQLEKIDAIRERSGVSYRKAREALQHAEGDVVEALVYLEGHSADGTWTERIQLRGSELVERTKELIREGNVRRIVIIKNDRTLMEIPVTVGVIGAVLMPTLAAIGAIAAVVTECTVLVERQGPPQQPPVNENAEGGTEGDERDNLT